MPSNLTRKELKQDTFAVEVGHTVDFFAAHRKQFIQYGGAIVVVALIAAGAYYFHNSQVATRQRALGDAITLSAAPVSATPAPNGAPSFTTDSAKLDAVTKAFTKVAADYPGDDEGYIAEYFLGGEFSEAGKYDDARKKYQDVADHADANYASLAKLSLAQIDFFQGKSPEAESLLKGLIDNPTDMVSKTQATLVLAKGIAPTRPDEARKMLTALIAQSPETAGVVSSALAELPKK